MFHVLSVDRKPAFNHSITACKERTYRPYAGNTFGYNDEIRIPIRKQEYNLLPSQSSVHIIGKVTNGGGTPSTTATLDTNFGAFLFTECRYELNGVEIDRTRNLGVASTMKGYASMKSTNKGCLQNAGWFPTADGYTLADATTARFHIIIPLSLLLGFAEDFQMCIVACSHELVLVRSSNDNCTLKCETADDKSVIIIEDIYWKVPALSLSHEQQARMLSIMDKNDTLHLAFRSWEMYELPALPAASKLNWAIKASSQLEKPRFMIFGFQTNRKSKSTNSCLFDSCKISKLKVFLNEEYYPNEDMRVKLSEHDYSELYDMYTKFQASYYSLESNALTEPLFSRNTFMETPLIVIDCSL